jgi:hypothetical protein
MHNFVLLPNLLSPSTQQSHQVVQDDRTMAMKRQALLEILASALELTEDGLNDSIFDELSSGRHG